jgi:hypothetical protein
MSTIAALPRHVRKLKRKQIVEFVQKNVQMVLDAVIQEISDTDMEHVFDLQHEPKIIATKIYKEQAELLSNLFSIKEQSIEQERPLAPRNAFLRYAASIRSKTVEELGRNATALKISKRTGEKWRTLQLVEMSMRTPKNVSNFDLKIYQNAFGNFLKK